MRFQNIFKAITLWISLTNKIATNWQPNGLELLGYIDKNGFSKKYLSTIDKRGLHMWTLNKIKGKLITRTLCTIDNKIVEVYFNYICQRRGTNKSENKNIRENVWNFDEVDNTWESDVVGRNPMASQILGFRIIDYIGYSKHEIVRNVNQQIQ